jgi:hypothetical protein
MTYLFVASSKLASDTLKEKSSPKNVTTLLSLDEKVVT